MNTKTYYTTMGGFNPSMPFKEIRRGWFDCFSYILKSFKVGFTDKSIRSLFYDFKMDNWEAMHTENTTYKSYSKKALKEAFCFECVYTSDRQSYDRLFRTHWLYLRAFEKEISEVKK